MGFDLIADFTDVALSTYLQRIKKLARYLIIDDHRMVSEALRLILMGVGIEVDVEASVDAALEKVKLQRYNLILLDFVMPGLSGTAAVAALWRLKMCPIVVLTGLQRESIEFRCLGAGAYGVVSKSISILKLKEFCAIASSSELPFATILPHRLDIDQMDIAVMEQILSGRSNRDAGKVLGKTERQMSLAVSRLLKLAQVSSRIKLVNWWRLNN